ncbi:Fic family protein [Cupriavidus sp. 2MCAB6]|uniref:Fic family protein n=1 Tax=Cupriavidus sp. 2MCAB6 TaxID=3232981 RepID=UPI003F912AFE
MLWIWQNKDWPHFRYDKKALAGFENEFLHKAGMLFGTLKHISSDDMSSLTVQLISEEAVKTSQIEGEILDRASVQSSIQRHFGLKSSQKHISAAENGIADMMFDLYKTYDTPLNHETLYRWQSMLMEGRQDLQDIGRYRSSNEPMQIISGRLDGPEVHYEAPPSKLMKKEMTTFIEWFNQSIKSEGALARSGIAHLYFECIHPFEDGNGRIGRAISEKSLSQTLGRPTLIALAYTIEANKKSYYSTLQRNSHGEMDVTDWLLYFSKSVLDAQNRTQKISDFLVAKIRFYDRYTGKFNDRQDKVIARMFKEGVNGFKGGLSAENYIKITGTSRATATRDLQTLVEMGALLKQGELRYSRYILNI